MPACTDCRNLTINRTCKAGTNSLVMSQETINGDTNCGQYQQSVSLLMGNTIKNEISGTKWENRMCNYWMPMKTIIWNKLKELNPGVPKDGSVGKIAFNVPNKARMKIRTQRFLTRKLNLNNGYLPDHIISSIANKINSVLFPEIKTELIKGKDITKAYEKCIGGGSCMTTGGEGGPQCTLLYEMNPDKIQMLTMYYMNDSARAIVYKLDNDKGYYLDRVYADCTLLEEKMYAYADNRDWYSYDNLKYKTTEEKDDLIISDLTYEDGHIPYMDTFGGTFYRNKLRLSKNCYDHELDSVSGYIDGTPYTCDWCSEDVYEDDAVSIGDYTYCRYCASENFTFCEHCNEYVRNDNAVHVEDRGIYVCVYCVDSHYTRCEDCGIYNKNDCVVINEDDKTVCVSCAEQNYYNCTECGDWFYDTSEDGYCDGCKPEEEKPVEQSCETRKSEYAGQTGLQSNPELPFEENE